MIKKPQQQEENQNILMLGNLSESRMMFKLEIY